MAKTACSYISQILTFWIGETLPAAYLLLLNLCCWTVVCSLLQIQTFNLPSLYLLYLLQPVLLVLPIGIGTYRYR